jgi:hypothetical protein
MKKVIAILCETPFQLISALNIAYTKYKEECVLFIMEDMYMSDIKFKIAPNHDFIKGVYKIERNVVINKFCTKFLYEHGYKGKAILKEYIPNMDYHLDIDRIICIKYTLYFAECMKKSLKNGRNIEIELIEEGLGEYLVDNMQYSQKFNQYMMKPEWSNNLKRNVNILKAPYLNETDEFKNIMDAIFNYKRDLEFYGDIIYFAQNFAKDYNMQEFEFLEEKIYQIIDEKIQDKKVCIKLHPRAEKKQIKNFKILSTIGPWESAINDIDDIESKILISISSTAIITPKLMCNKEPYVISLVYIFEEYMKEILEDYNYTEKLIQLLEKVKDSYKDKEKFFMPKNIEELEEVLEKIE